MSTGHPESPNYGRATGFDADSRFRRNFHLTVESELKSYTSTHAPEIGFEGARWWEATKARIIPSETVGDCSF